MSKIVIDLPNKVYENRFLSFLRLINQSLDHDKVIFDFEKVRFFIPAAWVALLTIREFLIERGSEVKLVNYDGDGDLFRYLQRIDFFKYCGLDLEENFIRRQQGNRFVPIKKIKRGQSLGSGSYVYDDIASEVASCLAPNEAEYFDELQDFEEYDESKTGLYDFVQYSVSELSRNVLNHSKSIGYVSAQYTPTTEYVRLAISDFGIGIRESFRHSPYWDANMNDIDAINLALQPEVSSKNDGTNSMSENAGMGLSFMKLLCEKLNGTFYVLSYTGCYNLNFEKNLTFEYPGTICLLRFKRVDARYYPAILNEVKEEIGLPKLTLKDKFK